MALVLAAIGIYGVLSGSVAERTREIGVRTALGASRAAILSVVVRQGYAAHGLRHPSSAWPALAGGQRGPARRALLFGVSRLDPATYAGRGDAAGAGVAALACSAPAWRAAHVDPALTFRAE